MKTMKQLTAAMVLLTLPTAAGAQESIARVFQEFTTAKGINIAIREDTKRDSTNQSGAKIIDFAVGQPNFKLFDKLQSAFEGEKANAHGTFSRLNPIPGVTPDTPYIRIDLTTNGSILIGKNNQASYICMEFRPADKPGMREVYAAEWWPTEGKNIRQGALTYCYGPIPERLQQMADVERWQKEAQALQKKLRESGSLNKEWQNLLPREARLIGQVPLVVGNDTINPNLPADDIGSKQWMLRAIDNVTHLSNGDWHRLFGLLTQKMLDGATSDDCAEDMIVSAGIIADLCNNATLLDYDEKKICAKRLKEVATMIQAHHSYAHDLLLVSAKRIEK